MHSLGSSELKLKIAEIFGKYLKFCEENTHPVVR